MTSPAEPHARRGTAAPGPIAAITPERLARLRAGPEPPLVVDLRTVAEREAGHLDGDVGIPMGELAARLVELPTDRPLILVDRDGRDAPSAAGLLEAKGWSSVQVLEGGLARYAEEVDPTVGRYDPLGGGLWVVPLPRPETGCLSYFLGDPIARQAIVVDPGIEPAPYVQRLRQGGWSLAAIVETHTHADHLAGHATLHLTTEAPIYVSRRSPAAFSHRSLEDGEELRAGALSLVAMETPGHTQDHLTLRLGDRIFTGDSLLIGACGRTDLEGGDPNRLFDTFRSRYDPLPDTTEVYPAHYGKRHALPERFFSTLGFERATNEALRLHERAEFVTYMTEGWPPKPADFDRIVRANLA